MNKTGLISAVAERTGMTKKDADAAVCAVFDIITDALREEEKVQTFFVCRGTPFLSAARPFLPLKSSCAVENFFFHAGKLFRSCMKFPILPLSYLRVKIIFPLR